MDVDASTTNYILKPEPSSEVLENGVQLYSPMKLIKNDRLQTFLNMLKYIKIN